MELKIGDLVKHRVHGFHGIVVSNIDLWKTCQVCVVSWCETGKSHLIDIIYLDKVGDS